MTSFSGWSDIVIAVIAVIGTWYTATHRSSFMFIQAMGVDPIPLGLSAFALTTFFFSAANANITFGFAILLGLTIFYGGFVEIIAGVQALQKRNTFAATAFCSNGSFWLIIGFALMPLFSGRSIIDLAAPNSAMYVGFILLGWAIFNIITFIMARKVSTVLVIVFLTISLAFIALAIGAFTNTSGFTSLGGWLGIASAVIAWYAMLAYLLTDMKSSYSLPIGRRG